MRGECCCCFSHSFCFGVGQASAVAQDVFRQHKWNGMEDTIKRTSSNFESTDTADVVENDAATDEMTMTTKRVKDDENDDDSTD